jgi:hypothetical protein
MAAMEVVHAYGDPFQRGVTIGEKLADGHHRAVEFMRRYTRRHGLSDADLEPLLAPYLAAAGAGVPRLVTHLEGVAAGSGLRFLDVFAVNAFEELYAVLELSVPPPSGVSIEEAPPPTPVERCTDVLIRTPHGTILGHNEQWYSGDDGGVAVLVEHPDSNDEVASVTPVAVGTLPLVGMNARGGALGLMSLSSSDERVGVPRALLGRDGIDAVDRSDAARRATRPNRAGGYTYAYAFADGDAFILEVTATRHGHAPGLVHTNHALHSRVAEVAEAPSAGSQSRFDRAGTLMAEATPDSVRDVMQLLADHSAEGQDICVHPDPIDGEEGSAIQFAMVCDVMAGVMWLAPGQPCTTPFEEFRLADLLKPLAGQK